ncbi:MAG: threonine aldolase [Gemmatales bacterium]|nr:MAG: threonine aldolase [Gemmatales bacterium]
MDSRYQIENDAEVFSPALVFYKDLIRHNLETALKIAGKAERMRPHVKTHKTREIVAMELEAGVTKHKCATIAEAEMLADCGAPDVLLAYPMVGPNCGRLARLVKAFPQCRFSVIADHPKPLETLSQAMIAEQQEIDVLIDVDVGQKRTGIAPGAEAESLYERIAKLPGVRPGGFHVYDGHNHQESRAERERAVAQQLEPVLQMRANLERKGLPVPRMVLGGTPTFPIYAKMDLPGLECSPGTCFLHDNGYGTRFPDVEGFVPAALLLTRVVSRPAPNRLTLDLGYKAIASDPPAGKRCLLPDLPDAKQILQNEEHLVIETDQAERFAPGDSLFAVPTHICPTCALHRFAYVVENGKVIDRWEIAARDRVLRVA